MSNTEKRAVAATEQEKQHIVNLITNAGYTLPDLVELFNHLHKTDLPDTVADLDVLIQHILAESEMLEGPALTATWRLFTFTRTLAAIVDKC